MGRKSAFTPEQWVKIERMHFVDGESINSLAKRFGVNESVIRRKLKPNKADTPNAPESLQALALQKVSADKQVKEIAEKIAELPISRQKIVNDLSSRLMNISTHLAGAAEYGAATAHRLSGIAHAKVQEIDDAKPLDEQSLESLKGVAILTKLANDSSQIAVNLLAANKETVKEMNQQEKPVPQRITVMVEDASIHDAEA